MSVHFAFAADFTNCHYLFLLCAFHDCFESSWLINCELGKNFAVDNNALFFKTGDELRIGKTKFARGVIDASNPNSSKVAFAGWERGKTKCASELADFWKAEKDWLPDFALFLALREHFGGAELKDWPDPVRKRELEALAPLREELEEEIKYHAFLQMLFFRQWTSLRAYANEKGISIIGDLPIYVSPDSAEVWGDPKLFLLDKDLTPTAEAGVPPDAFSEMGQHWGNPLYDWKYHKQTGFAWWKRRCAHVARLYDVVRIDPFRAFHTYWSVPTGAKDAREGHWEKGPGMPLLKALREVEGLELIAEDLGDLDDAARAFIAKSGLPGMKKIGRAHV